MGPPCLPPTAEFQKRECRGYLGVNLKFMTSARSTVAESVTQQVCQGWAVRRKLGDESRGCSWDPERGWRLGYPPCSYIAVL